MAAVAGGIVLEPLTKDNYDNWSSLVINYLRGQDLWFGVVNTHFKAKEEHDIWERKNAKALHIIQLACGSETLTHIKYVETASEAWEKLTELSRSASRIHRYSDIEKGVVDDSLLQHEQLHQYVLSGDWEGAKSFIENDDKAIFSLSSSDRSILHIAVMVGHEKIVDELVKIGKDTLLKIQDKSYYTALALAAELTGNTDIAKCIIRGATDQRYLLCTTGSQKREIPVLLAAAKAHKRMTRYLYNQTPREELQGGSFYYGFLLLTRCITAEIFDVALDLLQRTPKVPLLIPFESPDDWDLQPLYKLASVPSAFPSGSGFGLLRQCIYNILIVKYDDEDDDYVTVNVSQVAQGEGRRKSSLTGRFCRWVFNFWLVNFLGRILLLFYMCIQNSVLLNLPGMKKIYDQKKKHLIVGEILRCLQGRIWELNNVELREALAYDAMLQAAKLGIIEFIDIMSKANPNLLWANDDKQRDIFSLAIMNRRKNVFQLIHDARVTGRRQLIRSRTDVFGNTLLHLAAYLAPSSALDLISSPALQMQKEILWFKEVESIVHPSCKEATNGDDKKPHELFIESHKELIKAGEKWAKETAGYFIIMGTLIITIMFAAAFTVPGGNNQDTGVPLLLRDKIFTAFIISDAVSLFTASTSVLLFIGILTSGYAEKDFLHSLPWKLLFALLTLYLSVVSMIVAFCASIALIVKGHVGIKIAVMILGCVPVIVLVPSQQRLFLEIFNSTLRSK